ncbi:MAG: TatD family hydrolase [Bacteroidales bacterium]|nr:TatD family hydrolase [Bacteroidales bacterium]
MKFFDAHTHNTSTANKFAVVNLTIKDLKNSGLKPNSFYSLGIHPWYIDEKTLSRDIDDMQTFISNPQIVAIGECGLDKLIKLDFKKQIAVFEQQIVIAEKVNKPIVLHTVRSYQETIAIKRKYKAKQKWIYHGFAGSYELAMQIIAMGDFISIGTSVLKSPKLQQTIAQLKMEHFLIESDEHSDQLPSIYSIIAKIKQCSIEFLIAQQRNNFNRIFNLDL